MDNQQPSLITNDFEGSTTISKESTGDNITRKQPVYLKLKNVIYMITNKKNNKIYIGSAAFFDKRVGDHVTNLRKNRHHNIHLQRAWNEYGEENFSFRILETVDTKENLRNREQYYIDLYKPFIHTIGYNMCPLAERNRFGMKMPESAKIKIGNFWRGKKHSEQRKLETKKRVTILQGKPIVVFDREGNILYEFPSMSEASRQLNISITTISLHCNSKRRHGLKYNFKYKDIV